MAGNAKSSSLFILDDCEPRWTNRRAFEEIYTSGSRSDPYWHLYPTVMLHWDWAVFEAQRQHRERATFLCAQLWQRMPVRDLLNIIACFYSDAFGWRSATHRRFDNPPVGTLAQTLRCDVWPARAERMHIYASLVAFAWELPSPSRSATQK
jgi:hypothetical protein